MDQEVMEIRNMEEQKTSQNPSGNGEQKRGLKQFFQLGEVGGYFFRKKDPSRPSDVNIRMMHGINKISIIVFLLGVIYIILRRFL
jgi:hypothetical protein